ncbi:MAG: alpha/beta hydrolase family protein [Eubacteriales bacterium]
MNTQPLQHHIDLSNAIRPALRYDGTSDLNAWREICTQKLRELLGMEEFTACDPIFSITEDGELNGNRRIHFVLQTEEGYFTHADLLPPVQDGPLPLCVCLQGHSKGAHLSIGIAKYPGDEDSLDGDRDFAVRAVKEGFAALAVEQRAFGACGGTEQGPACERPVMTALLLGRTVIGERIWDVSRALDAVLLHFPDLVTTDGSVLMGNSGGGTATYYAACLEHRFDGYMPSCAVCTYRDSIVAMRHCSCNYIPRIQKYFDMGDLAVMIAPKKLVVVCGRNDPIFPLKGVEESFGIIQSIYQAAGVPDNCTMVVGEGEHRFYADEGWKAMKKLLGK